MLNKFVVLLMLLFINSYSYALIYRFVDRNGVISHTTTSVPLDLVHKGYDILSNDGRLIKRVQPIDLDNKTQENNSKQQDIVLQKQYDEKLLKLYSSVEDIERMLQRQISQIDRLLIFDKNQKQHTEISLQETQSRVDKIKESGGEPSEQLMETYGNLVKDIVTLDRSISSLEEQRDQTYKNFLADKNRFSEITNKK